MKSPYAKAWACVGIMMLGIVIFMASMGFLGNQVLLYLFRVLGGIVFIGGIILHYAIVRCPHCGSHLGRVIGTKCPYCGKDHSGGE